MQGLGSYLDQWTMPLMEELRKWRSENVPLMKHQEFHFWKILTHFPINKLHNISTDSVHSIINTNVNVLAPKKDMCHLH